MDDESTCMSEGMTVTFQCGEIERIYILLAWITVSLFKIMDRPVGVRTFLKSLNLERIFHQFGNPDQKPDQSEIRLRIIHHGANFLSEFRIA